MGLRRDRSTGTILGKLLDARIDGTVTTEAEERAFVRKRFGLIELKGICFCPGKNSANRKFAMIADEPAGCSKSPSSAAAASEEPRRTLGVR